MFWNCLNTASVMPSTFSWGESISHSVSNSSRSLLELFAHWHTCDTDIAYEYIGYWLKKIRVVFKELLAGTEIPGGEQRWRLHLKLHCHHQNDTSIKMGSDEGHFNVSLIVIGKDAKTVSINHNVWRERRAAEAESNRGLSAYQPNVLTLELTPLFVDVALPLGHTGFGYVYMWWWWCVA